MGWSHAISSWSAPGYNPGRRTFDDHGSVCFVSDGEGEASLASLGGWLGRHIGVLLALMVLPLMPLFGLREPLRPRTERANPLVEFSSDSRTLIVRDFTAMYVNHGYQAVNNDWSVELWDVSAGLANGRSSGTVFTLAATVLVLAVGIFVRRRGG